jgi:hypothetical protein
MESWTSYQPFGLTRAACAVKCEYSGVRWHELWCSGPELYTKGIHEVLQVSHIMLGAAVWKGVRDVANVP